MVILVSAPGAPVDARCLHDFMMVMMVMMVMTMMVMVVMVMVMMVACTPPRSVLSLAKQQQQRQLVGASVGGRRTSAGRSGACAAESRAVVLSVRGEEEHLPPTFSFLDLAISRSLSRSSYI